MISNEQFQEIISNVFSLPPPVQQVDDPEFEAAGVSLSLLRTDLIHPHISGNKFFKLKYNLAEAIKNNYRTLLTFGGAYSNHIYSAAYAGKLFNLDTIGVIRGEEHLPLNHTLSFAAECGMKFFYLDRKTYRLKNTPEIINLLRNRFGNFYLLPEGGTNLLAVKGCSELLKSIDNDFDVICIPCGTGGTIAGLISSLKGEKFITGFPVLRNASFLKKVINDLLIDFTGRSFSNWALNFDYHFNGYAKFNSELIKFIKNFNDKFSVQTDPVYTGKMLFGIYDMIKRKKFKRGTRIIAVHTGGLQGVAGFRQRFPDLL